MAQTELIMKRRTLLAVFAFLCAGAAAQDYQWKHVEMDGSRTGCIAPSKDNVPEAVGVFKGGKYIAPNGKVYGRRSIVGKTARVVLDAQPAMARVKDVIGCSTAVMAVEYPESALSNWFIDLLMDRTEELAGKKVDIGIGNFGGIRIDMPEGDIILDDFCHAL